MQEFVMEEKLIGYSNKDATHVVKGKRTKRLRLLSPCGVVSTPSSCSSGESNTDGEDDEEDMANCLILLAQGGNHKQHGGGGGNDGDDNKREKGSNGNKKIALGGHRASHKKPKLMAEMKKSPLSPLSQPQTSSQDSRSVKLLIANCDEFEVVAEKPRGPTISFQMGNQSLKAINGNKAKIHECSICGSEFTSGQALGGHMRRHRTSPANAAAVAVVDGGVRPRSILQLDLNLPAPEEDIREAKFQFPTQKSMVMSAAPALVDCHY
ncbi:unnamed protein product [Lathyrus oleraceus]